MDNDTKVLMTIVVWGQPLTRETTHGKAMELVKATIDNGFDISFKIMPIKDN